MVFIVGCVPATPEPKAGTGPKTDNKISAEVACQQNSDCACGEHITTKECFYGNKAYVDASKNPDEVCPDFCYGITGKLQISCVEGMCKQQ